MINQKAPPTVTNGSYIFFKKTYIIVCCQVLNEVRKGYVQCTQNSARGTFS